MSIHEIAADLTALCKEGKFEEAITKYYAENIVSVEPMAPQGASPVSEGLAGIVAKTQWFHDNMEVHEMIVDGPFVNAVTNTFAVEFTMDATVKAMGQRRKMREVAIYKVEGDKIVHEQFLMAAG